MRQLSEEAQVEALLQTCSSVR